MDGRDMHREVSPTRPVVTLVTNTYGAYFYDRFPQTVLM